MAAAIAQIGEVMRVLRAVVAASINCAFRTRGSLSLPSVRKRKMDTPETFSPTGPLCAPALNNTFDLPFFPRRALGSLFMVEEK
jgi:hypothetical protein